jgi:hypothetical protein
MKKKDLAEEYLDRKIKQEPFKSLTKGFEYAFSVDDLKAAFNAGRDSVVENIPELKWVNVFKDGAYTAAFSFGLSYRIEFAYSNKFNLFCNSIYINCYASLSATKQAANEHHKKRIKQALGL